MDGLKWIIILAIIGLSILFVSLFVGTIAMEKACEDVGGELSGSLDCRKGNEFYEIYPTNILSPFNYTVNKYPKTEE